MGREDFISALLLLGYEYHAGRFNTIMIGPDRKVRVNVAIPLTVLHEDYDRALTFLSYSKAYDFIKEYNAYEP